MRWAGPQPLFPQRAGQQTHWSRTSGTFSLASGDGLLLAVNHAKTIGLSVNFHPHQCTLLKFLCLFFLDSCCDTVRLFACRHSIVTALPKCEVSLVIGDTCYCSDHCSYGVSKDLSPSKIQPGRTACKSLVCRTALLPCPLVSPPAKPFYSNRPPSA